MYANQSTANITNNKTKLYAALVLLEASDEPMKGTINVAMCIIQHTHRDNVDHRQATRKTIGSGFGDVIDRLHLSNAVR